MLVPTMKSKRQGHPNVRLGEIPAPFSCGIIQKFKVNSGDRKRKVGNKKKGDQVYVNPTLGSSSQLSEFTSSDSTETQKWGGSNPSLSAKRATQGFSSDDTSAGRRRLGLGAPAPEARIVRRGRSIRCGGVVGSSWHSGITTLRISGGDTKARRDGGSEESMSNIHAGLCPAGACKASPDPEASPLEQYFGDRMPRGKWEELSAADEGYRTGLAEGGFVHTSVGPAVVNSVRGWLHDLGFGEYARIFELHEVDGQVLPQLTFEDLKEMGVETVGSRRKMLKAIQLLKDDVSAVETVGSRRKMFRGNPDRCPVLVDKHVNSRPFSSCPS